MNRNTEAERPEQKTHITEQIIGYAALPTIVFLILIIALSWTQFKQTAPYLLYFLEACLVVTITAAITGFFIRVHQKHKAELDRFKHQTYQYQPDPAGNYPAYFDHTTQTFMQAIPGQLAQAVPHTYSPHLSYQYKDSSTRLTEEPETKALAAINQPTLDFCLSQLEENALQVCLGVSTTTTKPFVLDLIDGTHYRIIGGSGFGKSCEAAAILQQATTTNDQDHLLIALLDLEHKTSRLFEHLPHVAEMQVGRKHLPLVATNPDEVAAHFRHLRGEMDRRASLSEYDLERERFLLIYVEEFLSLQREIDPTLKEQMLDDFSILALRGRKYRLYLLACAHVDYAQPQLREAMNQFNVNMAFTVRPPAARSAGFSSTELLKQNFAAKQRGQFVLETTGCTDILVAPHFDVKARLQQLERTSRQARHLAHNSVFNVLSATEPLSSSGSVQTSSKSVQAAFDHPNGYSMNPAVNGNANDTEPATAPGSAVEPIVVEVLTLHSLGWSKTDTVERVWNCTKGGSKRYQEGSKRYDEIIRQYRSGIEQEA